MKLRIALLVALAALLVPGVATAAVVEKRATASTESSSRYWTEARMAAAVPVTGPSVVAEGDPLVAEPARGGGVRAQRVADPSAAGVRMHGKAFFRMGNGDFVCSATVVGSKTDSTVWTAGHCVDEGRGGGFARRWIFVPAYDGEAEQPAPYGAWSARKLATTSGFARRGDLSYDIGAAKVGKRQGQKLAAVVGEREIAFGQAPRQIQNFGYPAVKNIATGQAFDGESEWSCSSSLRDRVRAGSGPKAMKIGCDMTAGASGGGWVAPSGDLIGITSFVRRSQRGWDNRDNNSPFFGGAARKLYRSIAR